MINIGIFFRYYDSNKGILRRLGRTRHPIIQDLWNQLDYAGTNQNHLISAHQLLENLNSVLVNNKTAFSTSSLTNSFLRQVIYEIIQEHPSLDSFPRDANQSDITQQLDDIIDDLQTGEPVIFKTITRNHTMLRLLELINQKTESELTNTDLVKHLSNKLQALDDEQLNLLIKMFSPRSGFYPSNFDQDHYFWTNAKIPLDYMEVILNEPQPDKALIFYQSLLKFLWKDCYATNGFVNDKEHSYEVYTSYKHLVLDTDGDPVLYAESIMALRRHLMPTDRLVHELASYSYRDFIKQLLHTLAKNDIQTLSSNTIHNILQSNAILSNFQRLKPSASPDIAAQYVPDFTAEWDNILAINNASAPAIQLPEAIILQCLKHSAPAQALQSCYVLAQNDMLDCKDWLLTTISWEQLKNNKSFDQFEATSTYRKYLSNFLSALLKRSAYFTSEEKRKLVQTLIEQQFPSQAVIASLNELNDMLPIEQLMQTNQGDWRLFDLYKEVLTQPKSIGFVNKIKRFIQDTDNPSLSKTAFDLIALVNTTNLVIWGDNLFKLTLKGDKPKYHLIPKLKKLINALTPESYIKNPFATTAHNYIAESFKIAELNNFKTDPILDFLEDDNAETIVDELSNKQLLTEHHLKLIMGQQEAIEVFQRPHSDTPKNYYQNACKIIQILDPETRAYLQPSPLLYLNQLLFENEIDINNVYQSIQNDQQRELVSAFLTYMLQMIIKALSYDYRDNLLANKHIDPSVKNLILDISNITDQTYSKYYKLFTNATASGILTEHPEFFRYTIDYADEYDIDYEQLTRLLDAQTENGSYIEQHDLKHPLLLVKDIWRLHQIQQYYDSCQSDSLEDLTRSNLDTLQKSRNVQYVIFRALVSNNQVKELLQNTPNDFFANAGRLQVCFHIAGKQYDNNTVDVTRYNINDLQRIIEAFIRLESCFNNLDEVHRLEQTQQNNLQNFPRLNDSQQTKLIATLTYYQVTPDELEELITLKTSCFECTSALDSILHFWTNHDIELTNLITRVNDLTAEATSLLVDNLKTNSHYHTQLVNSILKAHPISTPDSSTNTENADQHVAKMRAQKLFSEADLINLGPCIGLVNDIDMQSSNAVVTLDKDLLDDQTILQGLQEKYAIDTNSSVTNNNPFINMAYIEWLVSKLNSSSDTAPTPRHPITRQLLHLKKISDSHININLLKTYLQDYHESTYFQQRLATVLLIDDLLQAKANLVKAMHEANSANQTNSGAMYPQLTEQGADINKAIQKLSSSSDSYDMQTHFINILNKMDQAHTLSHFANQLGPYHASLANTVTSLCHTRKNANDSDTQPGITLNDMIQHYNLTNDRMLAAHNQASIEDHKPATIPNC